MYEFFSRVDRGSVSEADVIAPLEPVDQVVIEQALCRDYPATPQGFQKLCTDIAISHNPRTIQVVTHLLNSQFAEQYFKVAADQKLFELTGEIHTASFMTGRPGRGIIEGDSALKEYTYQDPKLFLLLGSEFYTQWCERHEQSPGEDQSPGDDAIALFLEHHFRGNIDFSSYRQIPAELQERFTQAALDYFLHNAVFSSPSQAHPDAFAAGFNKLHPEQIVGRLLNRLGDGAGITAREKYNTTLLLSYLNLKPSKVDSRHNETVGHVNVFGQAIDLDRSIEQSAYQTQLLSARGDIGVVSGRGELVGKFNWQDLQSADHVTGDPIPAHVSDITLPDLFYQAAEANIPLVDRERVLTEYTRNYWQYEKHEFFTKCQVPLRALAIKEQAAAVQLLLAPEAKHLVQNIAERVHGNVNILRMCLLTYAATGSLDSITASTSRGREIKPALFQIYQPTPDDQRYPLETFADFVDQAELAAQQLHHELGERYPDITLSVDDVIQGLITGALHTLGDVGTAAVPVEQFRQILQKQITEMTLGLTYFREIMGLAEQSGEVDLNQYVLRQEVLEKMITNPQVKSMVVRHLVKEKLLKPVPKISWEVDRNLEACSRRDGFDLKKYLLAKAAAVGRKLTVLELGMGSGMAKADRVQLGGSHEFNVSDAFYYNLGTLCKNVLDFPSLSENIQLSLTESDQKVIGEILYKLIVVQAGQEAEDYFMYNDENLKALTEDPVQLLILLKQQFPRLAQATCVPSTISRVDEAGITFYPNKIHFNTQTPAVQAALQTLAERGDKYIKPNCDVLSEIPFHPAGTIIGDFNVVSKFKPNQCDVIVAARSTVYKYGAAWITLQKQLVKLLRQGSGELIDDSIRDNDGGSYRFAEIMDFIDDISDLAVVTGKPFPNEDYRANRVPLAHVIASGKVSRELLRECLQTGAQLEEFTQLVNNEEYLTSLTADGKVAKAVKTKQSSATSN